MGYDFEGTIYKGNVFGVNYAGTLYMGIHQCFMQVWFCHTVPSLRSVRCWGGYLFAVVYNCQAGPDSCLSSLMCQDTESIGLGIITVS